MFRGGLPVSSGPTAARRASWVKEMVLVFDRTSGLTPDASWRRQLGIPVSLCFAGSSAPTKTQRHTPLGAIQRMARTNNLLIARRAVTTTPVSRFVPFAPSAPSSDPRISSLPLPLGMKPPKEKGSLTSTARSWPSCRRRRPPIGRHRQPVDLHPPEWPSGWIAAGSWYVVVSAIGVDAEPEHWSVSWMELCCSW